MLGDNLIAHLRHYVRCAATAAAYFADPACDDPASESKAPWSFSDSFSTW